MATSTVTIKIPYGSITTISAEHTLSYQNGKKSGALSLKSDATEESKQAGTNLGIPLSGLPETAIIKSVKIPITNEISGDTAGNAGTSYAVVIENTQYGVDANGNITDGSYITHLNNYKNQHGVFPDITFIAGSWVFRPSSNTATVKFILDYPTIICTVEGSQITYRPNADVSVGHEIPSGFSGVYQLLNESSSDGDTTCISSHGGYDETGGLVEDKTSVVTIGSQFPNRVSLIQLRLLASIYIYPSNALYVFPKVTITLSAGDSSVRFLQSSNLIETESKYWKSGEYYLFEGITDYTSDFVQAVNSYYKTNGVMPKIDISLNTYADGEYSQGDYKTTSATSDAKISQVYLEAVFQDSLGMSIYHNEGGTWKQAQTAYEKRNGAWVEITEAECKSLLASSFIIKP